MDAKEAILKENGSYNKRFASVRAEAFSKSPFFDARDVVQVKYELLRAVERDGSSVSDAARMFGFSRKAYYQISRAYRERGLAALAPGKTGPKGPNKLRGRVSEFIDLCAAGHEKANSKNIAAQMEAELDVKVHPRTIERYLEKKTAGPNG